MADAIEIESGGKLLKADGDLQVSTTQFRTQHGTNMDGSVYRTMKPVAPYIRGYVCFERQVTHAELMAVTNATVRCAMSDGRRITFRGATLMSADPGRDRNGYDIDISGKPEQ